MLHCLTDCTRIELSSIPESKHHLCPESKTLTRQSQYPNNRITRISKCYSPSFSSLRLTFLMLPWSSGTQASNSFFSASVICPSEWTSLTPSGPSSTGREKKSSPSVVPTRPERAFSALGEAERWMSTGTKCQADRYFCHRRILTAVFDNASLALEPGLDE